MRRALSERPVKGTSACVCVVDETKETLDVNKVEGFSKLRNIQFEEKGIRVGVRMEWAAVRRFLLTSLYH